NNGETSTSFVSFVADVATIGEPPLYEAFFKRWEKQLDAVDAKTRPAKVNGRMVIGLGDESVIETAITLHHTYGVPMIPGSALKGLAAHYARNYLDESLWGINSDAYRILFGDTTSASYLTFYDALYIAGSGFKGKPLYADVITVHHRNYYQQHKDVPPPADWDSPTIIPFLSATGSYLVALGGDDHWVNATFTILGWALAQLGIGA
ncbi:MAG TPA: type III-B CRISPR module RAMP protein Cmr6, partial [Caldilineaceae bacterium]|nr:type III-B CRISPR module RAMP protein Cmr6 [Caldilineaceae bacterium]